MCCVDESVLPNESEGVKKTNKPRILCEVQFIEVGYVSCPYHL